MQAARTNAVKALHRFGPPTLIMLGSLWLLQAALAHTGSHGVIIRNLNCDAGPVKAGSTVTDTFQFINLSSAAVEVNPQPGCGCTVLDVPNKALAPLHVQVVKARVDTDGMKPGAQKRPIMVNMRSGGKVWQQTMWIKFLLEQPKEKIR